MLQRAFADYGFVDPVALPRHQLVAVRVAHLVTGIPLGTRCKPTFVPVFGFQTNSVVVTSAGEVIANFCG
jgi:hypothetical protein